MHCDRYSVQTCITRRILLWLKPHFLVAEVGGPIQRNGYECPKCSNILRIKQRKPQKKFRTPLNHLMREGTVMPLSFRHYELRRSSIAQKIWKFMNLLGNILRKSNLLLKSRYFKKTLFIWFCLFFASYKRSLHRSLGMTWYTTVFREFELTLTS